MENKTIATVIGTTVLAGTLAATLILNPVEQTSTPEPTPTPTATISILETTTPTPTPAPTGSPSATPTPTPSATQTPTATATPSATQTPRVATLEDYAIRTVLEDGTVIVTYAPDTPQELLDTLIPKKKGAK